MTTVSQRVLELKADGEDYNWYPTTNEILDCIAAHLIKHSSEDYRTYRGYARNSSQVDAGETHTMLEGDTESKWQMEVQVKDFIDVGTGNGKVLNYFKRKPFKIINRYGVEKARAQADDLIRANVALLGRDYFETVLIDKSFGVAFSNPPYDCFKEWCVKLLSEIDALFIYLVIPQRWKDDADLASLIRAKGESEVIGSFDFANAERVARAKVDVIAIRKLAQSEDNPFKSWVEQNIGKFEVASDKPEAEPEQAADGLQVHNEDKKAVLVDNYKRELKELLETYRAVGKLDFALLQSLGMSKQGIIDKIYSDIKSLKNRYWKKAIEMLEPVKERLTYKTRQGLFEDIKWFESLDFSEANILTLLVWVCENANRYIQRQTEAVYDDLTNFETVRAYKSNDKWIHDGWRYQKKGRPERWQLDYRIVVHWGYRFSDYEYDKYNNPVSDLTTVAHTLGFSNQGAHDFAKDGSKKYCYKLNGEPLFEYKCYKNNNVHFKLDQDFLMALNITVGRMRGWLRNEYEAAQEFDITEDKAKYWFACSEGQLLTPKSNLLLSFGGNK